MDEEHPQTHTEPSPPPVPVLAESYARVDKLAVRRGPIYRRRGTWNGVRIVLVERGSDGSGRVTTADGKSHTIDAERIEWPSA